MFPHCLAYKKSVALAGQKHLRNEYNPIKMYLTLRCSSFLIAKAMWKQAFITIFSHFEDKLLISLGKRKCGNMSI